jgi:hypothetical protein
VAFNFRNSDPDDNKAATPPLPPGTPEELQPPAEPVTPEPRSAWNRQPVYDVPGMDWKSARRSALYAGIIGGIGSLVPSGIFIVFWMLAAGGISITIYRRRTPHSQVTAVNGFRIGAMAGFIGFLFNAILTSIGMLSSNARAQLRESFQQRLTELVSSTPDPAAQQTLKNLGDWIATPGGLATFVVATLVFAAMLFFIIAGLGGAIGASLFGKHESKPAH